MPIRLLTSGGGTTTIQPTTSASDYTLTVPAITANVITSADSNTITQTMISRSGFYGGFGPLFMASPSGTQTLSHNTTTKIALGNEILDTNGCFDPTTNYRFTPNVAGYYMISFTHVYNGTNGRTYYFNPTIYKNGSNAYGIEDYATLNSGGRFSTSLSVIMAFNGSTDYTEFYAYAYDYTATTTIQLYASTIMIGYFIRGL